MHEGQVIRGSLFIAGGHPPELFQPVDTPFAPAPLPVHLVVEPRRAPAAVAFRLPLRALIFPLRDHVPDPPAAQHPPALRITVALIQRRLVRPLPGPAPRPGHADAIEHRHQLHAFVPLARRQADRQRPTPPVGGEVQLGGQPTPTATERLVGRCDFPLFPPRPAARPVRACGAPPPRPGGPGRWCRQSRPPSTPPCPRPRPRPAAPGAPAPRRRGAASGAGGRGRSSTSRTAPADPARGPRCARPRGSR